MRNLWLLSFITLVGCGGLIPAEKSGSKDGSASGLSCTLKALPPTIHAGESTHLVLTFDGAITSSAIANTVVAKSGDGIGSSGHG